MPYATAREKAMGTVRYATFLVLASALTQLVYAMIMFILHFKYDKAMTSANYGIFPLFFVGIVVECNENPELPRAYSLPNTSVECSSALRS